MNRNRGKAKLEGEKEGKLFYLFCEGKVRETQYFDYFVKVLKVSQVKIHIAPVPEGSHTPAALLDYAIKFIEEKEVKNEFWSTIDEVWIVLDTDTVPNVVLSNVRAEVAKKSWFIAQSNPCFEVWLYYHHRNQKPPRLASTKWKRYLNDEVPGGFNSNRHPCLIETAIINSAANFSCSTEGPDMECTEVHLLAEKILPLVKPYLDGLVGKPILV